MKKLIYGGLFFTLVAFGAVGCKKKVDGNLKTTNQNLVIDNQPAMQTSHKGVLTNGKILIFESSEIYNSMISNLDSTFVVQFYNDMIGLEFNSLNELTEQKSLNNGIDDYYLKSILNQDNIIQIGKYLYRVNKTSESVFVLHHQYSDQYADLVNENTDNINIKVYSTEEDVIDLVEAGVNSQEKGLFCKDRRAQKKDKWSGSAQTGPYENMKLYVKYKKFGIYHALSAEGYRSTNSTQYKYYYQIENSSYRQRCGSSLNNYSHPWRSGNGNNVFGSPAMYSDVFRLYSGMKQLKNYRFKVRLRCNNYTLPRPTHDWTPHFTDYVLIQDY